MLDLARRVGYRSRTPVGQPAARGRRVQHSENTTWERPATGGSFRKAQSSTSRGGGPRVRPLRALGGDAGWNRRTKTGIGRGELVGGPVRCRHGRERGDGGPEGEPWLDARSARALTC